MRIVTPKRGDLIITIPLWCKVRPLMRPRYNPVSKSIYSPKENQVEVFNEISQYQQLSINRPIIVDLYIYFTRPEKSETEFPTEKTFGDIDNLTKGILDAMVSHKIIEDDKHVVGGQNYKLFAPEDWAIILIYECAGKKTCLPYGLTKQSQSMRS